MDEFMSRMLEALRRHEAAFPPVITAPSRTEAREGRGPRTVAWGDLPTLDLSQTDTLDCWFRSYESRMKANGVQPEYWHERFVDCPSVSEEVKTDYASHANYTELRRAILVAHGPTHPTAFYMRQLHRVTGETGQAVREKLRVYMALYNRAVIDAGRPELIMDEKDLVYAFCDAFPPATSERLLGDIGMVWLQEKPLEQLFRRAPGYKTGVRIAQTSTGTVATAKREPPTALATLHEQTPRNFKPRRRLACERCGGDCQSPETCRARERICYNCHRRGHFASQCRAPRQNAETNPNNAPVGEFRRSVPTAGRPFRPRFPTTRPL
jgi:hypothetical protein